MTPFYIVFTLGLFIGCFFGMLLAGLLGMAGATSRDQEHREHLARLKKEYP